MRIRSVAVGLDTVEALVEFDPRAPLRTSELAGAAERTLSLLPGLRGHRCDNGRFATFADELADTELAHLLEHSALELMALAGSPDTLRGRTSWDFLRDGDGVFRVSLQYDDDLVALGALRVAGEIVGWLEGGSEAPDVAAETARLRAMRAGGAPASA